MSEQVDYAMADGAEPEGGPVALQTGHETVDAVLRSLDDLEDRPVEQHVEVFESAHEALRAALAGAGDPAGQAGQAGRPGPR